MQNTNMADVWVNSIWPIIPEKPSTLLGAATWRIQCHDPTATRHIAGYSYKGADSIGHGGARAPPLLRMVGHGGEQKISKKKLTKMHCHAVPITKASTKRLERK